MILNRNIKKIIYVLLGATIIIFATVGYIKGYRITSRLHIKKMGSIKTILPLQDTSIFINNKNVYTSTKENEEAVIPLLPDTQSVIISKINYFPWTKNISISSGESVELHPIMVSQNPTGEIIGALDDEYWKIKQNIATYTLPTKDNFLLSPDGTLSLWIENNSIIGKQNDRLFTIVEPEMPVKNISFYKNRSDAIIFSTGVGLYVIETDTDNFQNFMPLYRGQNPYFIPNNEQTIYVEDGRILMLVVI